MSVLKARVSGAWQDTAQVGKVRYGGEWLDYGSPVDPGPTLEALTWPNPPTLTDGDDNETYNLGTQFYVLEPVLCYGIEWEVPDTVETPPGGTHVAGLWDLAPLRLAVADFVPVPGTTQRILFEEPVLLAAAPVEYVASVLTIHYSYSAPTPGSGWTVKSPSENVWHETSKLSGTSDPSTIPSGAQNAWYFISPLVAV